MIIRKFYFHTLAVILLDIHLPQECVKPGECEVIQDALGHKDVFMTLNIYTDVTKELRKSEFEGLELQFNQ